MAGDESGKQSSTRQLGWLQGCLLRVLAGILGAVVAHLAVSLGAGGPGVY
jgi:uncharacterized membrane protein YeaQ/YmgE (transglycosylase-associated protein family)